jgi:hypothetical protein
MRHEVSNEVRYYEWYASKVHAVHQTKQRGGKER